MYRLQMNLKVESLFANHHIYRIYHWSQWKSCFVDDPNLKIYSSHKCISSECV